MKGAVKCIGFFEEWAMPAILENDSLNYSACVSYSLKAASVCAIIGCGG